MICFLGVKFGCLVCKMICGLFNLRVLCRYLMIVNLVLLVFIIILSKRIVILCLCLLRIFFVCLVEFVCKKLSVWLWIIRFDSVNLVIVWIFLLLLIIRIFYCCLFLLLSFWWLFLLRKINLLLLYFVDICILVFYIY